MSVWLTAWRNFLKLNKINSLCINVINRQAHGDLSAAISMPQRQAGLFFLNDIPQTQAPASTSARVPELVRENSWPSKPSNVARLIPRPAMVAPITSRGADGTGECCGAPALSSGDNISAQGISSTVNKPSQIGRVHHHWAEPGAIPIPKPSATQAPASTNSRTVICQR